jgi:hypothetical protein
LITQPVFARRVVLTVIESIRVEQQIPTSRETGHEEDPAAISAKGAYTADPYGSLTILSYPRNPITSLRTNEGVWFCQALGQVFPVL